MKSKILLIIVGLAVLASVGISFYKYVILKDYLIFAEVPCDPAIANCFVRENEDGTIFNYLMLSRKAYNIPLCDPANPECRALVCEPNEQNCEIKSCSPDDVPEGEKCVRG